MKVAEIKFKLSNGAKRPTKHLEAGAFDLYILNDVVIKPESVTIVKTGVSLELPENWHAFVKGCSGIDSKYMITVEFGLIDNDYRGDIGIIVKNNSDFTYKFNKHTKFAQLVPFYQPLYVFKEASELSDSERGEKGFGSSGL